MKLGYQTCPRLHVYKWAPRSCLTSVHKFLVGGITEDVYFNNYSSAKKLEKFLDCLVTEFSCPVFSYLWKPFQTTQTSGMLCTCQHFRAKRKH